MVKFRWIFYFLGLAVVIYFIKKVEKKVENSDEVVHQKKRELEDLLRKVLNKEIDNQEFLKKLQLKFELNTEQQSNFIEDFVIPPSRKALGIMDVLTKREKQRNRDNVKYISFMTPVLYQFIKGNIDETEFYKVAKVNDYKCKKRTWKIKIFENADGVRDFSLYKITKKQQNDTDPIKNK